MILPAYIAGIADSDGSFSIVLRHKDRLNPHYFACFQLGWKESSLAKEAIEKMKSQFGGSISYASPSENSYGRTKMIKYMLQGKKLESFLEQIIPFLILKREHAETLLTLRRTIKQGSNKTQELLLLQESLYLKMKELNTKNSANRFGVKYANHKID